MANWFENLKSAKAEKEAKLDAGAGVAGDLFAKRENETPHLENELAGRVVAQGGYGSSVAESAAQSAAGSGAKTVAELIAEKKEEQQAVARATAEAKANDAVINRFISNQKNEGLVTDVKPVSGSKISAAEAAKVDENLERITRGLKNQGILTEVTPSQQNANISTKETQEMARERAAMFTNANLLTEVKKEKKDKTPTTEEEIKELEMIGGLIAGRMKPGNAAETTEN